jgi:hypothetical protein
MMNLTLSNCRTAGSSSSFGSTFPPLTVPSTLPNALPLEDGVWAGAGVGSGFGAGAGFGTGAGASALRASVSAFSSLASAAFALATAAACYSDDKKHDYVDESISKRKKAHDSTFDLPWLLLPSIFGVLLLQLWPWPQQPWPFLPRLVPLLHRPEPLLLRLQHLFELSPLNDDKNIEKQGQTCFKTLYF